MKNSKFKILHMIISLFMLMLCLTLLIGCGNGEEETIDETPDTWLTSEEFTEIMERHGAFVTNMSEISDSFAGIFLATDLDAHPMEAGFGLGDDHSYIIMFNSSDCRDTISEEYHHIINLIEREGKLSSDITEENGIIRHEILTERSVYHVIINAGNVLIHADGPETSRNLINSLVSALGF